MNDFSVSFVFLFPHSILGCLLAPLRIRLKAKKCKGQGVLS